MIKRKAALLFCFTPYLLSFTPTPYIAFRSQSVDAARELVGLTQHINLANNNNYYTGAITPVFTRSFDANRIADCLFGQDLASETLSAINITGSGFEDRDACKDWLADYFGLPRDFNATIRFEPIIDNIMADLYLYAGLNHLLCGLYFTLHAPIVYTNWDLNFVDVVGKEGDANHPSGYFNQVVGADNIGVPRGDLLDNFTQFAFKQKTPDLGQEISMCPLQNARMVPKRYRCLKSTTQLSDLQAVLGWNMIQKRWYHFGAGIRAVAPTGNAPKGTYVFEPIVGNGKHWELGMQLWGHYTLWHSENEERSWMLYGLANITHMFNARQERVFDLCGKPNSRYMLAERVDAPAGFLRAALLENDLDPDNLFVPSAAFANVFCPVANLTKRAVNVSVAVQADMVAMLTYTKRELNFDLGYNCWLRSCEKITRAKNICSLPDNTWALKGDAYVYGFSFEDMSPENNTPVALSATQSKATIHEGTNNFVDLSGTGGGVDGMRPTRNPGVDNRYFAAAALPSGDVVLNDRTTNAIVPGQQTNTSYNPIYISEQQLDLCNAATKGISHTIFVHLSRSWTSYPNECFVPFFGGGGFIEFGQTDAKQGTTGHVRGCQTCALSQWGVWLKGGVTFNS